MKHLFAIAFLCFSGLVFGQENDTGLETPQAGPSFTASRKTNFSGFIGENSTTVFSIDYVAINRKKQELNLRRYALSDLSLVDSKDLFTVIDEAYYNEPNEIFFQNNSIYLFSTLGGLKEKFNLLYLEIFNEYGEKINGMVIDTLAEDEKFYLTESIEKEGFLLATHNKYDNIFDQTISLFAINGSGKTDWSANIKSPVSLQNLTVEEVVYSKEAPVYILCDYGFDVKSGSARENNTDLINSKYALWAYDPEAKFLKEFDIRIKNRWINGISLTFNSAKELIVSGFMNETRNQTINGVFSLKISPEMEVMSSNFYKYKRAFFEKFVDAKRVDKTKELEDVAIRNCLVLADDSYFIFGEHFYQFTDRNYDPRTNITTTTENYNYNSIIAAYFDANGNHIWSDRIPKFQHSINDHGYFSSFSAMQYQNEVYLIFNDTERNNDLAVNDYLNYQSLSNNRRFQISYVRIGQEGIKSRGSLINRSNNFILNARQSYQINTSKLYLYTEAGKSRKVFSITPRK
jgi:hypothetical protein